MEKGNEKQDSYDSTEPHLEACDLPSDHKDVGLKWVFYVKMML